MNTGVRGYDPSTDLQSFIDDNGIKVVKMGAPDIDGIWRGKRIMSRYFVESVAQSGSNACDILFGWDMLDQPNPGITYTGWHTGYPDITFMPDLATLHVVPDEPGTAAVICDINTMSGEPLEISPRQVLRRVIERANSHGLQPICAYEFEFFLFEGTPKELARKGWRELVPITEGNHTYSIYRDVGNEFIIGEIRDQLAEVGVFIEASNSEYGPGQFEVNIHYGSALEAADSALLLKHKVKEIAVKHGYTASFMAKIKAEYPGSSGHVHQSLVSLETGEPVFSNKESPGELSDLGMKYLAGLLEGAKDLTAINLPVPNSYRRIAGAEWAGSSVTWGEDNRTVAFRSIPSGGPAARVENRIPGSDTNPYLVLAASIASGILGIERGLTPPEAIVGNAYALGADSDLRLPNTLEKAIDIFEQSDWAKEIFGEKFVKHYTQTRRWEIEQDLISIPDWEVARLIEHI